MDGQKCNFEETVRVLKPLLMLQMIVVLWKNQQRVSKEEEEERFIVATFLWQRKLASNKK